MSRPARLLIAALVLALVACASAPPPKPVVLTVPRDRYVPVPDKLTNPCAIEEPTNYTVAEAVRVARARKASLEQCNDDKAAIRAIQGTQVPARTDQQQP